MLTPSDLAAVNHLRARVFGLIARALDIDGVCKVEEGRMAVVLPDYFESLNDTARYHIELYCYVVGPNRRYSWSGRSIPEACQRAHKELDTWEVELDERGAA